MKVNAERGQFCGIIAVALCMLLVGCSGAASSPAIEAEQVEAQEMSDSSTMGNEEVSEVASDMSGTEDVALASEIESEPDSGMPEDSEMHDESGRPLLVGLDLQQTGPSTNQVVAEMLSAGFYTLDKTAPSEYILTLEEATLDPSLSKTVLAPRGSGRIRSVRPTTQGRDVVLRIFADPDALLQARSQGGKIIVSAVSGSAMLDGFDDPLAQAALEEAVVTTEEDDEQLVTDDTLPAVDNLNDFFGETTYTGRLISLDLQDTDIDNALRIIAEVSNLNIIASDDVTGKVTLRLIDVPWDQALDVILKTNGLDKVQEGNVIRIAPVEKLRAEREALKQARQAEEELEPLKVRYLRISYAKAAELQPLVETVLSERGTVAYDERTNQLIVKDIAKGLRNVTRLVGKLDLRTPQVLIETQIVEAERTFTRELGSELGFFYVRSPETGNPTPYNFPNSIAIGGSAISGGDAPTPTDYFSAFPALDPRSAVDMLFSSADGTKGLQTRLTQAEKEGRARVVSRPSVAVTNNTPAVIKSVTKLRIKLPDGGVAVGVGGGSSVGGGSVASEVIEIGIVLNVTAQASPDYYILMDIDAKSSTLGGNGNQGVDNIPPEVERKATSTVLVSSGQTFALGGIYQIREREAVDGVPWLKDVPVLGHFFRSSSVSDSDEELIFFLTPRIIEGSFDDAAMKSAS